MNFTFLPRMTAAAALLLAVFTLIGADAQHQQAACAAPLTAARAFGVGAFGARGDGVTDDTAALQRALDSLHAGDTLLFARGKTYRHSDVLSVNVAGVRLSGPGTLLATDGARFDQRARPSLQHQRLDSRHAAAAPWLGARADYHTKRSGRDVLPRL